MFNTTVLKLCKWDSVHMAGDSRLPSQESEWMREAWLSKQPTQARTCLVIPRLVCKGPDDGPASASSVLTRTPDPPKMAISKWRGIHRQLFNGHKWWEHRKRLFFLDHDLCKILPVLNVIVEAFYQISCLADIYRRNGGNPFMFFQKTNPNVFCWDAKYSYADVRGTS